MSENGEDLLHAAAESGSVEAIRLVLDNGGLESINAKDNVSVS
jgi:hypothetical protein